MGSNGRRSVLITGGAGFIGSHTAERFLQLGYSVAVLDDFSTGNYRNVPDGVSLHGMSILDDRACRLITRMRPAIVVHCAAQISVPASMKDPLRDLQVNLVGTARLLEASKHAGVERFVFLSSGGAIYGETAAPADESTPPCPASYYGAHKLAAEHHVSLSGLSYAILRPSNVYGPRQRHDQEGGVVSILARQAVAGGPFTITGDGEQSRDFVNVHDVAGAIVATSHAGVSGTWNVSTGTSTSINELTCHFEKASHAVIPREHLPARPGDVRASCLDSRRIQRDTGWVPRVDLEQGLCDVLAAIRASDSARLVPVP